MGVAAYNRGSERISLAIRNDYRNERGIESKEMVEQMQRAQEQVEALESFCLNAQSLYIDTTDPETAKGMLKAWMRDRLLSKHKTSRFNLMLSKCLDTHIAWIESDHRHVFEHLQACRNKARAWLDVLSYLNVKNVKYPFEIPAHI